MSLIGIDVGSSSVKTAAYAEDGKLLAVVFNPLTGLHPEPDHRARCPAGSPPSGETGGLPKPGTQSDYNRLRELALSQSKGRQGGPSW
jgi:hypothetical protein